MLCLILWSVEPVTPPHCAATGYGNYVQITEERERENKQTNKQKTSLKKLLIVVVPTENIQYTIESQQSANPMLESFVCLVGWLVLVVFYFLFFKDILLP